MYIYDPNLINKGMGITNSQNPNVGRCNGRFDYIVLKREVESINVLHMRESETSHGFKERMAMIYTKAWRMHKDIMVDLVYIDALTCNVTNPGGFRREPSRRKFTPKQPEIEQTNEGNQNMGQGETEIPLGIDEGIQ